jgi:hypothetical protein
MNVSIATVAKDVGTTIAGSILIGALTSSLLTDISGNPNIPPEVQSKANVQLASGVPFISDAASRVRSPTRAVSEQVTAEGLDVNETARIEGLNAALGVLALIALVGLFFASTIPTRPPGDRKGLT